jgi:hypothetical protein
MHWISSSTQDATRGSPIDEAKSKPYQQGLREGHADKAKNKDHSKKRRYKTGEDQKSYEAGYQKGRN